MFHYYFLGKKSRKTHCTAKQHNTTSWQTNTPLANGYNLLHYIAYPSLASSLFSCTVGSSSTKMMMVMTVFRGRGGFEYQHHHRALSYHSLIEHYCYHLSCSPPLLIWAIFVLTLSVLLIDWAIFLFLSLSARLYDCGESGCTDSSNTTTIPFACSAGEKGIE